MGLEGEDAGFRGPVNSQEPEPVSLFRDRSEELSVGQRERLSSEQDELDSRQVDEAFLGSVGQRNDLGAHAGNGVDSVDVLGVEELLETLFGDGGAQGETRGPVLLEQVREDLSAPVQHSEVEEVRAHVRASDHAGPGNGSGQEPAESVVPGLERPDCAGERVLLASGPGLAARTPVGRSLRQRNCVLAQPLARRSLDLC